MTKRDWLIFIGMLIPMSVPILMLVAFLWLWVSGNTIVLPEPLPNYPNSQLFQEIQPQEGVTDCGSSWFMSVESYRVFSTPDSKEKVLAYYNDWAAKQKLQTIGIETGSNRAKGESHYCYANHEGSFDCYAGGVGFAYLNYAEPESFEKIKKFFPNWDTETNIVITLRGTIFCP